MMEIRKVIIYITRDGVLHTSQERARRHAQRAQKAQADSARTLATLFNTARVTRESAPAQRSLTAVPNGNDDAAPSFTSGTHKERILAAIKAGHKKTSDIKRATGIKANVLYADLAKLRSERVITATNRLKTTRSRKQGRKSAANPSA